jgi:hypothetical protein
MVCRVTTNYALGGANIFQHRGSCSTYPTGYLVMTSPEVGAIELAGVSPFSVTLQLKVGAPLGDNSDWGTLTSWCISWGDGTSNNGTFGSATPDYEGFLYFIASNISHTYKYDDTTSNYTSRAYRPWATISDTCGNEIVIDYGQYIHVCRSDAAPDRTGGCSRPADKEIPEIIGTPPKTVCVSGSKLCVKDTTMGAAVGYFCQDGAWTFDPNVTTDCWDQNVPSAPATCAEGNVKCESSILYTCTNKTWVPGTKCGSTPTADVDSHGCIIGSSTWCEFKDRCVQTGIESCCITGTPDSHGCVCNETVWCDVEKMCKYPYQSCNDAGIGTYDNHGCLAVSQTWCATEAMCKNIGGACAALTHYKDNHGCYVDTEHWCSADGVCKATGQMCTVSELTDEYGCLHDTQTWCAAENKCKINGATCGSGTGGNGADDILEGETFGIDNKMLLVGGIALLGIILLAGGAKAGSKK